MKKIYIHLAFFLCVGFGLHILICKLKLCIPYHAISSSTLLSTMRYNLRHDTMNTYLFEVGVFLSFQSCHYIRNVMGTIVSKVKKLEKLAMMLAICKNFTIIPCYPCCSCKRLRNCFIVYYTYQGKHRK